MVNEIDIDFELRNWYVNFLIQINKFSFTVSVVVMDKKEKLE